MENSNVTDFEQIQENQITEQNQDEGFVSNPLVIQKSKIRHPRDQPTIRGQRPNDFMTRYIRSQGILRKQPKQVYETPEVCEVEQQKYKSHKLTKKSKQKTVTLFDFYVKSKLFRMVYSRYKQKTEQEMKSDFTACYLNLENIMEFRASDYMLVKPFKLHSVNKQKQELVFQSRFESGNLMYALRSRETQDSYHLLMQNDINTQGYNQWFYFSVQNLRMNRKYKLKIVNFKKKQSLFAEGMKPVMFSLEKYKQTGNGWTRNFTKNVKYEKSNICKNQVKRRTYFCLEFELEAQFQNDYILISMGMPYSYSKLTVFLDKLLNQERIPKIIFKKQIIGYSLSNNAIPLITITSNQNQQSKKYIGILARQHPGETWPSYLMEKLLIQLTSDEQYISALLKKYIFKIIPMVNVDGVIYGNFRTDISGMDLNRQWKNPSRYLNPQLVNIKNMVMECLKDSEFEMFFDLHGHSKKYNSFSYSCKTDEQTCRLFPYIIQKFDNSFCLSDCTFGISKDKENTARAFLFNTIKKQNVMTLELSFFGTHDGQQAQNFQPYHMKTLAKAILKGLFIFSGKQKLQGIDKSIAEKQINLRMTQFQEYDKNNENDSGSESDPFQDELQPENISRMLSPKIQSMIDIQGTIKKNIQKKNGRGSSPSPSPQRKIGKIKELKLQKKLSIILKKIENQEKENSNQKQMQLNKRSDERLNKKMKKLIEKEIVILKEPNIRKRYSQKTSKQNEKTQKIHPQPKQNQTMKLNNKTISNHTVYNNLKFKAPTPDLEQPRHNRVDSMMRPKENSVFIQSQKRKQQYLDSPKRFRRSTEDQDEALAKRIQSTMLPMYQNNTLYQNNLKMPRMAVLHESIETKQLTYPLLGITANTKFNLQRIRRQQIQWTAFSNHIFPARSREKSEVINFEKFKRRSQREKSKFCEVSKIWRENFEKYNKQMPNSTFTIDFK